MLIIRTGMSKQEFNLAKGKTIFNLTLLPIGRITGGKLKTPAQEDGESIQAGWFPAESVLLAREPQPLRGRDILPLIKLARGWYMERERAGGQPLFTGVPARVGHVSASLRLVAVHLDK